MPGLPMNKPEIRLVAIDLDGTLLRRDKTISERTIQAIQAALAQGCQVIFCTGRSRSQFQDYLALFPTLRYAVSSGGAVVYDVHSWEKVITNELDPDLTEQILQVGESLDCFPFLSVDGRTLYSQPLRSQAVSYGLGAYLYELEHFDTPVPDVYQWYRESPQPVQAVSLYFREEWPREVVRKALRDLPVYMSFPPEPAVEVSSVHADKGRALSALCARLHIPVEQTLAIGDSDNDLPVLRTAGISVAMGNAPEDVKQMADHITADCDEEGVALALEHFVLLS